MLVIVPYLVQHPGTSLEEVASLFGVAAEQLREGPGSVVHVGIAARTVPAT